MSMAITKLCRCLPTVVVLLTPSPAFAAPDPEQATPVINAGAADPLDALVVVRVEVEGGAEIAQLLRTEVMAALRQAEVEPDLPGHLPLEVVVSPDVEIIGAYEVVYRHHGEVRQSWSCPCSGEELRARLAHDTIDVWNAIVASSRAAEAAASPAPIEPESLDTQPRSLRRKRGFGFWVTGITTTAVGTSLVVGAAALLIADAAEGHGREPVTLGLLGGGVAMVAAGVTLWSIGARRRNHPRLSILPATRSRGVLVTVAGSF